MNKRTLIATAAALAAPFAFVQASSIAVAQDATTATTMESVSTEQFVQMATVSNMFEIESSELAVENAQSDDVKEFAQQMIEDHTAAAEKMQTVLQSSDAGASMPDELDEKHAAILEELQGTDSESFDAAYVDAQVQAHQEAVALFSAYAENGEDEALKSFATETLPTLEEHYEMIQQMDQM